MRKRLSIPFCKTICLFTLSGLFSSACNLWQTAAPPGAVDVVIRISGGNAIVMTDGGNAAVVGPVADPAGMTGSTPDFNDHDMDLMLEVGERDPSSPPPDTTFSGVPLWRAKGYDISLCEEAVCTPGKLEKALAAKPAVPCADGDITDGNFFYVPNLTELHPGSQMVGNWRERLGTRLTLTRGKFVTTNVVECFDFKDPASTVVRRESLANGEGGVRNQFTSTAKFINVVFSQNGTTVKTVRVNPLKGRVQVALYPSGHPRSKSDELKPGDAVQRFAPFYDLLDPASIPNGRLTITYSPKPTSGQAASFVNPGPECPLVTLDASSVRSAGAP